MVVLIFLCLALFIVFFYGPTRRIFVTVPKVEHAATSTDIGRIWTTARVKGRVAILMTRYLNAEDVPVDPNNYKFANIAMKHGIVRTIYHVVPDCTWIDVEKNLSQLRNARKTANGYILIVPEGRIYIAPLSRFEPIKEVSLLVVEPAVWTEFELGTIRELMVKKWLSSDLITIVRGVTTDIDRFKSICYGQ